MITKTERLNACVDQRGIVTAVAMDQRGSLRRALQAEGSEASDAQLEAFKVQVSEALTPHASAILLESAFGLPAARVRAEGTGLLLAYEESGYDQNQPGRIPLLQPAASVRRLLEAGADAIKLLVYYDPFDAAEVLERKHAFVERAGAECEAEGAPLFLEPVSYNERVADRLELARLKPEVLVRTVREFTKPRYRVDVLKLEFPVDVKHVAGMDAARDQPSAYSREEASEHLRAAAAEATVPFVFLSAGVDMAQFVEALSFAGEAGVPYNGVLCGRATWKGGIAVFARGGERALRVWLDDEGVRNITALNEVLARYARPLSL